MTRRHELYRALANTDDGMPFWRGLAFGLGLLSFFALAIYGPAIFDIIVEALSQ